MRTRHRRDSTVSIITRRASETTGSGSKQKEDWVYREVAPVLPPTLWDACNAILAEQEKTKKKPVNVFTGLVFCKCGGRMYVPSNSPKYICYKCRNKIGKEELEEVFHEQLKDFVFSPDEVAEYLSKADGLIKEKEELLEKLSREERQLKDRIDNLIRLRLDGEIARENFAEQYQPLNERREGIKTEIPELQSEVDFLKIQYLSGDQVLSEARDFHSGWTILTDDEKRKIIETITERITVA